jgi:formylglycine-generating enzyme required for sulfatase activity
MLSASHRHAILLTIATGATLLASTALADVFNMPVGQTSLLTVPVGNPGNAADPASRFGAVNYNYNIGEYEVTAGQYAAFLNSVAATDTYALYNADMSSTFWGPGIIQHGNSGTYTYTVASGYFNRPVTAVTFWDACRFANWLANGQPTGPQGAGTTETGTYSLNGVLNPIGITRNTGATWAVASENEWYKAAYYDPNKNGSGHAGYWLYPTKSDATPGNDPTDPNGNNANYFVSNGSPYPIQTPYFTTVVGQFLNSASAYGTFDQGGNALEWTEETYVGYLDVRGGAFDYGYRDILSTSHDYTLANNETYNLGFRIVQVPEPASLAIFGFCAALLMCRHGRKG